MLFWSEVMHHVGCMTVNPAWFTVWGLSYFFFFSMIASFISF